MLIRRLFGKKQPKADQPAAERHAASEPAPATLADAVEPPSADGGGHPPSQAAPARSTPTTESVRADNRSVRVFVSSTFRDMGAERDELMAQAWPELRRFCRERQVELVEVDLRWGISEEQSTRKETLKLCLDEIRACRPFFIGLLGERYGWVPDADAFTPDLEEEQPWVAELRDRSVTELEILHGVLNAPEMAERAFFYFRDPAYAAERGPDFCSESPAAAARQADLKARIRAVCAAKGFPLREDYADPRSLAELVQTDLQAAIDAQYPAESIPDPLSREARDHEAAAEIRRRTYIGRQEYYDALDHHAQGEGGPLVLLGESGSGKSALLANWLQAWSQAHPGSFIFQHYIGGTPGSADHWALLNRLLAEIKRWTADPTDLPKSHDDLLKDLAEWLARLRSKAEHDGVRAIVVLDALNQLEDRDGARWLGWLPDAPFTGPLRLIVSTLPGDTLDAVTRRGWPSLRVVPLSVGERRRMIVDYLKRFGKQLDDPRLERLAAAPAAANPLFLKLLLDELRVTGTHERLDERLNDYLSTASIPALLDKILARYEAAYETERPGLVGGALALVWTARRGMSEAELLALLRPTGMPQLPPAIWASLRAALDESLVDRGGILAFAHDFMRAAIERRYVPDPDRLRDLRLRLADFFQVQPASVRSCDELPWLLCRAEARDRLRTCLLDLPRFLLFQERDEQELLGYWLWLAEIEQMGSRYVAAFDEWAQAPGSGAELLYNAFVANQLGYFLLNCGQPASAEPLLRRALVVARKGLGPLHPNTLVAVNNLAGLLEDQGDYAGAEHLYRQALDGNEQALGRQQPGTLVSMNNLAELLRRRGNLAEAESLLRGVLAASEQTLGPQDLVTLRSANSLADVLGSQGDYAEAEPLLRRALAGRERVLGPDHPDTLRSVNSLALLLQRRGDLEGAERMGQRALDGRERVLGAQHPETLASMNNLGELLRTKGDYGRAEPLLRRALEGAERTLGAQHPDTLTKVSNLALLLESQGDYAGAVRLYRRALSGTERALGEQHPNTLTILNNLALVMERTGDYVGAEPLYRRALAGRERVLGAQHPDTLQSVSNLAAMFLSQGDNAGAEPLLRRALAGREQALGPRHPDTLTSANNLALLLKRRGDYLRAELLYRRALEGREEALGPQHPDTLATVNNLALLLEAKGDNAGAEPLLRRALTGRERVLGPQHPDTLLSLNNLAFLLEGLGDHVGAEPLYRRALEGAARLSLASGRPHPNLQAFADNYTVLLRQIGRTEQQISERLRQCGWPVSYRRS